LRGIRVAVPADLSSAAFFLVGASIAAGSDLVLEEVGVNPTRTGVLEILRLLGADIEILDQREQGGEPVADLRVRARRLRGTAIPSALVPLAIDEFPVLFVGASCAEGTTIVSGAEELRHKESDRIAVMAEGLTALGGVAIATPDGIRLDGGRLKGGVVDSHGDHRVAMAFAMAGLCAEGAIEVRDCANVDTSFPGFAALAHTAGLNVVSADD
jgi:3-phosphoshikimate 1-carboxyvinyltransferase